MAMEDLLDEMQPDGLGLNIVCDETEKKVGKILKTKSKVKNKYDARRQRRKLATGTTGTTGTVAEKESTPIGSSHSPTPTNKTRKTVSDLTNNDEDDPVAAAPSNSLATDESELRITPSNSNASTTRKDLNSIVDDRSTTVKDRKVSRKNQHSVTSQRLEETEKRAQYMSTFHARPHEMDRKSGAVAHFNESKESTHIFGDDDNDSESDSKHETVSREAVSSPPSCPFEASGLHSKITYAITKSKTCNYFLKRPTMVQKRSWCRILQEKEDKSFLIQSETGSGKTLAYFLPLLQSLAIDRNTGKTKRVDRKVGGTRALILAPTRELATQIYNEAEKLCINTFPWIVPGILSGGVKRKAEKQRLRKGVTILIATPGRLLDHLDKTECLLMALKGKIEWVILDESDRLLDMGLGGQLKEIVQRIRANQGVKKDSMKWQCMLVSATISKQIKEVATNMLGGGSWVWVQSSNNVETDSFDHQELSHDSKKAGDSIEKPNGAMEIRQQLTDSAPRQLKQVHITVSAKLRLPALVAFLATRVKKHERVVIFVSTCDSVDFHHSLFTSMDSIYPYADEKEGGTSKKNEGLFGPGNRIFRLHGNVPHRERQDILKEFSAIRKGSASILIATDVAARGLNLPDLNWIIQYDAPCDTADYVHRAGRACRAGKAGHALLFLLPSESQYIDVLKIRGVKGMIALSLASILDSAASMCLTKELSAGSERIGETFTAIIQKRFEDLLVEDDTAYKSALEKKVVLKGGDKYQRRRERKEAKHAVGPLLQAARKAYTSYVRGYSTREKAVRHIFSSRALHLGHIARSFALKDQPGELSRSNRNERIHSKVHEGDDESEILKSTGMKRNRSLAFQKNAADMKGDHQGDALPAKMARSSAKRSADVHESMKDIKSRMLNAASLVSNSNMEFM